MPVEKATSSAYPVLESISVIVSPSGNIYASPFFFNRLTLVLAVPETTSKGKNRSIGKNRGSNHLMRARWMSPTTGRFVSSDAFDGEVENPVTLWKYAYSGNSPVNFSDPSGYLLINQAVTTAGLGILAAGARISFARFLASRVALPLLAAGATFLSGSTKETETQRILRDPVALEELRRKKRELAKTVTNEANGAALLFHYGDRYRALSVYAEKVIPASAGYAPGGRPPGAYATSIPPWFPQDDFTQRKLSATFYGGDPNRDVSWFVAIKKQPPFRSSGALFEFVAPAPVGTSVSVVPVFWGPNLMLW